MFFIRISILVDHLRITISGIYASRGMCKCFITADSYSDTFFFKKINLYKLSFPITYVIIIIIFFCL